MNPKLDDITILSGLKSLTLDLQGHRNWGRCDLDPKQHLLTFRGSKHLQTQGMTGG